MWCAAGACGDKCSGSWRRRVRCQRSIADALAQGDESGAEHLVDVAFHLLLRLWARPTTRGTGGGGERERTREREVGGRDGGGDEGEGRELSCPASIKVRTLLPRLHGGGGAENDSNSEGKEGRAFKRMKTGGTAVPRVHASNSAESVGTDTQAHAGTRAQTDTLVAWMVTTWKEIVQNVRRRTTRGEGSVIGEDIVAGVASKVSQVKSLLSQPTCVSIVYFKSGYNSCCSFLSLVITPVRVYSSPPPPPPPPPPRAHRQADRARIASAALPCDPGVIKVE